ncbi:MAG: MerR family transcriptional regulator [Desulfobacteraceae bacterium]|jgi:DNA-binding transcriptional MerR regulator|nr:MerR family transcriptional regulator [Desulfobacteraceae bacterium]
MKNNHYYKIGQVAAQTGLPPYLIRVWQSRYSAVSPLRSSGNRRIFCADDIRKLQLLSKAVESGHSISQIASLSQEELMKVVERRSPETRYRASNGKITSTKAEPYLQKSLQFVAELDINGLQSMLDKAAINLTRPVLILDVIVPLYFRTKSLVQTNNLRLINLTAVTSFLQAFMWDLLRTTVVSESAPKIMTGTLTGQRSEIAALALALIAVESGYKSIYLGSNLPANDLAAAVKSKAAQAVAIFVEGYKKKIVLGSELSILQEKLGEDFLILVCAHENLDARELIKHYGISVTTLKNFRTILETLTIEKMM